MDILCNYQGSRQCELIVVFDAYRVKGHVTEFMDYYNIHVVYTKKLKRQMLILKNLHMKMAENIKSRLQPRTGLNR